MKKKNNRKLLQVVVILLTIMTLCVQVPVFSENAGSKNSIPQIRIENRTATIILTLPDSTVVKIAPNEALPPIKWGTKISATFGTATIICGEYRLNLVDGGVVVPYFNRVFSRTTIKVPAESLTSVTVNAGNDVIVMDKNEIVSLEPGSRGAVQIVAVKGEIEISNKSGQKVLTEGEKTAIYTKDEPAKQVKGQEEAKKEVMEEEMKVEEGWIQTEPQIAREDASPSSP